MQRCNRAGTRALTLMAVILAAAALNGCSLLFGGGGADETPTEAPRVLVPTFTPTQASAQPAPTEVAVEVAPDQPAEQPTDVPPTAASVEESPTPEPTLVPGTPTPIPKLIVSNDSANVRSGPGTDYGLVGTVTRDQAFDIIGKNPEGTWWQLCCVNGQQAWIFGELVSTENADTVAVAADIPAPPVAAAPAEPAPAQPAPAQPAPADTPTQAPPPASDPCAGIGGDGCKFKVRRGPAFGGNGGTEIRLQLFFIHSGVDGGQPQGSYFVALFKDGVKLPISDSVRSRALDKTDGALGPYNYEIKVGMSDIPGNTVAGNYVMYVLDGNGERDSQDFGFTIPDGQGDVWIEWDQG